MLRMQCPATCHSVRTYCYLIFIIQLVYFISVESSCPDMCGKTTIPYPFGLGGCGLKNFTLYCSEHTSELQVWIGSINFTVLAITSNTLVINPLRMSKCGTPNFSFFHFTGDSYVLPKTSYVISKRNVIMMYNCAKSKCDCGIHSEFAAALQLEHSFGCPPDYCCGILHLQSLQSLMNSGNCTSFVSWSINLDTLKLTSPVNIQVQYGLELEAWVPGPCSCAKNARCKRQLSGHMCECLDGYVGDGFLNGLGCHRNGTSCRRGSFMSCSRNVTLLTAGVIAGTTIIVIGVAATILLRRRRYQLGDIQSRRDIKQIEGLLCNHRVTKVFPYRELEKATKNFSDHQRLGNGAFGTVYAGKLSNGTAVAVKRINYRYMQGVQQVVNEVKVLAAVRHPNLVRLLGCCLEYGDPLLVYEYVPNGTLAEHLQAHSLSWARRVNIALETAQALSCLHSFDPPIYHRDVKSSNILLDYNFTCKVADFGLSRLVLTDNSHISTVPQGTPGYLDPDYHQNFHLSEKSDVYSFGVVLVEMITALKAVDLSRSKSEINLANLAVIRIGNGTLDDVIDESLHAGDNPEIRAMIQSVAEIAYRCLSYDKDARPTIKEVAQELEYMINNTKELKLERHTMDKIRTPYWSTRRDSFTKIRSDSCSSIEEICGSIGSSISSGA